MDKKVSILLSALLAVAAVFSAAFMGARLGAGIGPKAAVDGADTEETAEPLEAGQGIAIPGYDEIKLKSRETDQTVYFHNPAQNHCFFVISLMIDGVEIYKSERIPPGAKIESISLSAPLYAGSYSGAVLSYSCYDLYTQRELNGAEMPVKLEVE